MNFQIEWRKGQPLIAAGAILFFVLCRLSEAQERFSVPSRGGAQISVEKSGSGPALLLVHGSSVDGSTWERVLPGLDGHFTVYVMDRRGHGHSSDAKAYSISDEANDVVAVTTAIGQPLTLLAHSYGALCTLLALSNLQQVSHLILYEPPPTQEPALHKNDPALIEQMETYLHADRKNDALILFLKSFVGVPPPAVERMKTLPNWSGRVEMAPVLPREVRAVMNAGLTADELGRRKAPTTMFLGSTSPQSMVDNTNFICRSMRDCQVMILQGQGHLASNFAPDLFVAKVLEAVGDTVSGPHARPTGN